LRTPTGNRVTNLGRDLRSFVGMPVCYIPPFKRIDTNPAGKITSYQRAREYKALLSIAQRVTSAGERSEANHESGRSTDTILPGVERTRHNIVDYHAAAQHVRQTAVDPAAQRSGEAIVGTR
jgi:hypothetical protein